MKIDLGVLDTPYIYIIPYMLGKTSITWCFIYQNAIIKANTDVCVSSTRFWRLTEILSKRFGIVI
jgi:hypothetical protein